MKVGKNSILRTNLLKVQLEGKGRLAGAPFETNDTGATISYTYGIQYRYQMSHMISDIWVSVTHERLLSWARTTWMSDITHVNGYCLPAGKSPVFQCCCFFVTISMHLVT